MENRKQELVGKVVSNKNDKTITVIVETYKTHPLYKKRVKYSKKYVIIFVYILNRRWYNGIYKI